MTFDQIQDLVKSRFDGDSYFSGLGLVARKGFAARVDTTALQSEVDGDLADKGISFVIGLPAIDTVAASSNGRASLSCRVNVDLIENAEINRGDSANAVGVAPEKLSVEVFAALLGQIFIKPYPEDTYEVSEDKKQGLHVFRCSFMVEADLVARM